MTQGFTTADLAPVSVHTPFWQTDVLCSPTPDYRVWLGRNITGNQHVQKRVIFCMLNPSRARGEGVGDHTQRKCDGFAQRLGFERYGFVNLFTLSTPYPKELFAFGYDQAVGEHADLVLERIFRVAAINEWPVVMAWGRPSLPAKQLELVDRRVAEVKALYEAAPFKPELYTLATLDGNVPRHPLMLGYALAELKPWSF